MLCVEARNANLDMHIETSSKDRSFIGFWQTQGDESLHFRFSECLSFQGHKQLLSDCSPSSPLPPQEGSSCDSQGFLFWSMPCAAWMTPWDKPAEKCPLARLQEASGRRVDSPGGWPIQHQTCASRWGRDQKILPQLWVTAEVQPSDASGRESVRAVLLSWHLKVNFSSCYSPALGQHHTGICYPSPLHQDLQVSERLYRVILNFINWYGVKW